MSFLKSLFSKKQEYKDDKEFTEFFNDAVSRYFCDFNREIKIETTDKADLVVPPSHIYNKVYKEWKTIESIRDKRILIFSALDKTCLKYLDTWQFIERWTLQGCQDKASKFIEEDCSEDDFKNADFLTSAARCYFFLSVYEKTIQYAKTALEINGNNKRAKLILADALHLTGEHDKAHDIYKQVLAESNLNDSTRTVIGLNEIVDFRNDIIHSSVYAVSLLSSSNEINEGMWNKVASEFYHCPYFRSQHAYWLFEQKENLKGLAELTAITIDFPWYKDAVINTKQAILQFREQANSNDMWEGELLHVNELIETNNWT